MRNLLIRPRGYRVLGRGIAFLSLLTLTLVAVPFGAHAQDSPEQGTGTISNKPVNLDLESADLYYGLKLLFQQIKANFTLDNSLKGIPVTVHLKDTPFRVALAVCRREL